MNAVTGLIQIAGILSLISSTPNGQTLSVTHQNQNGMLEAQKVSKHWNDFDQLLTAVEKPESPAKWYDLKDQGLPLSGKSVRYLGIGLSYQDHADEVGTNKTVFFEKNAEASKLQSPIPFRPYLDFELEIALLLNRHDNRTFGYMLHNDLTDRKIQALNYDANNPGPGFTLAKSFQGANPVGTLIAIDDTRLWEEIDIELIHNGVKRQTLSPRNNVLKPEQIHEIVFSDESLHKGADWVVIGTGTTAGTIFRAPTTWEKAKLYVRAGFSKSKATQLWLDTFRFLEMGDEVTIKSKLFGNISTSVGQ